MRIGPYEVLFELARGGMGTVYLARAVGPNGIERLVAIKRAQPQLGAGTGAAERFLDEARITAQVHHANVVGMHQSGLDDTALFLVFDYIEGESLGRLVTRASERGERVPPRVIVRVALDALAGLHAAHETTDAAGTPLGILHRDVSIQNLLVGRDGVTRLTDFGIAKSTLSSSVTDAGYVQGNLVYLAPEYLQRLPVDRTLDIYAIGVTLWIALAGRHPFHTLEPGLLIQSILTEGVPSLASAGVALAPELEAIVARACCRDSRVRFQHARQMLTELEAVGRRFQMVASYVEVAECVELLAGADLAARREQVRACRAAAAEVPAVSDLASPLSARAPRETTRETAEFLRALDARPPWRNAAYVSALVALVAAVVLLFWSRQPAPAARAGAEIGAPTPSSAPMTTHASESPSASAALDRGAAPPRSTEPIPPIPRAETVDLRPATAAEKARADSPRPTRRVRTRSNRPAPRAETAPDDLGRGRFDAITTRNPYK